MLLPAIGWPWGRGGVSADWPDHWARHKPADDRDGEDSGRQFNSIVNNCGRFSDGLFWSFWRHLEFKQFKLESRFWADFMPSYILGQYLGKINAVESPPRSRRHPQPSSGGCLTFTWARRSRRGAARKQRETRNSLCNHKLNYYYSHYLCNKYYQRQLAY